jgi:hypothetical protein
MAALLKGPMLLWSNIILTTPVENLLLDTIDNPLISFNTQTKLEEALKVHCKDLVGN